MQQKNKVMMSSKDGGFGGAELLLNKETVEQVGKSIDVG